MFDASPDMNAAILMLIGFTMVFAEIFVPAFGLIGIAGLALFTWGGSMIFSGDAMMLIWAIDGAVLMIMAILGVIILRSRRRQTVTGIEGMIGKTAHVQEWSGQTGIIQLHGELWQARSHAGTIFHRGDEVVVSGCDDLVLTVRKEK